MALADLDAYLSKLQGPYGYIPFTKGYTSQGAGNAVWRSLWTQAPFAGATPTSGAPTRTTTGALPGFENGGSDTLRIARVTAGNSIPTNAPFTLMLADRLSHSGGLDATSVAAQTTNLPTTALTRYTTGAGVFACLEIYTQIGTTATTATVSYTDQGGTAGNTSAAVAIGATNRREIGTLIPISLAAGDTGVRAVASVTLALSTGTAGNFGVTLLKPLALIPVHPGLVTTWEAALGGGCGNLAEIVDDACLTFIQVIGGGQSAGGVFTGSLELIET
jgi:hypothetical protein